jgi:hypothetical protein
LVAVGEGTIHHSLDAGITWTEASALSKYKSLSYVASSADGTKLVAVTHGGSIYTSGDSGATWESTSAPVDDWSAVASSADGTILLAVRWWGTDDIIYPELSTNSGGGWAPAGVPAGLWNSVACSSAGNYFVAAGYGRIAILHSPPPAPPMAPSPHLAVSRSGGNLGLSWLVPSTPFVLQQNSDLRSPDWVAVPTPPTLNLTNLHYEVTLAPGLGASFYRLRQQ